MNSATHLSQYTSLVQHFFNQAVRMQGNIVCHARQTNRHPLSVNNTRATPEKLANP